MIRTWVIAHRGDSSHAPENTLAAFEAGFRAGADGIELDTMLSADGVPVVIHDDWLERTTGVPGSVWNSTLAELKRLDAGAWFGEAFRGERIPTLAEALELARNRGIVNVEIKSKHVPPSVVTDAVLRVIGSWSHPEQILISSFDPRILHRVRRKAPWLRTGFLRAFSQRGPWRAFAWWSRADFLHVDTPLVSRAALYKGATDRVVVWTVDQETEIQRLAAEGVRAIVTNVPGKARELVDALRVRRTGVLL